MRPVPLPPIGPEQEAMRTQARTRAARLDVAINSNDPRALRADGRVRIDVARDEGASRARTIALALLAAAALWAAILIPAVLFAGN